MRYTTSAFLAAVLLLTFALTSKTTPAQVPAKDATPLVVDGKPAPAVAKPQPNPSDPITILRSAKTIHVQSSSVLVSAAVVEAKLLKRSEFQQLGLVITRDPNEADLILELEHDVFTKYVYTAIDPKTNIVVASGKLSSLGGTVAGKVAKRFLKQVLKARTS
jgi:hypothetical protein